MFNVILCFKLFIFFYKIKNFLKINNMEIENHHPNSFDVNSQRRLRDEIIGLFLRNYTTNLGSRFINISQQFLRNVCFIYFSKFHNKYLFFQLQNRRFIFSNYEESVEFRKKLYLFNIYETQIVGEAGINNYIYYLNDEEFRKYCSENLENEFKPLIEIITKPFVFDSKRHSIRIKRSFPFELPISFVKQFNSDLNKKKKREQYKLENTLKIKKNNVNQTKLAENTGYIEIDDSNNNNDVNNTNIHLEKIINENIKIIPNYDIIQAKNIGFFSSAFHGIVTNKLKTLPPNIFLIVMSPFNRMIKGAFFIKILNNMLKFFKQYINIADVNNIYNIIKSIMHSLLFLGSSVYLPNQKYIDLILTTDETDTQRGLFDLFGLFKLDDRNIFEFVPSLLKIDESQLISENKSLLLSEIIDNIINTSTPNKYYIYFVNTCRSVNFTDLPHKVVEKLYQYENFISFLNRSICETLSRGMEVIDIPQEVKKDIDNLRTFFNNKDEFYTGKNNFDNFVNLINDTKSQENYNIKIRPHLKLRIDYLNNLDRSKNYLRNTTLSPIINNDLRESQDRARAHLRDQKKKYESNIRYIAKNSSIKSTSSSSSKILNIKKNLEMTSLDNLEMTSLDKKETLRLRLKNERLDREKKERLNMLKKLKLEREQEEQRKKFIESKKMYQILLEKNQNRVKYPFRNTRRTQRKIQNKSRLTQKLIKSHFRRGINLYNNNDTNTNTNTNTKV